MHDYEKNQDFNFITKILHSTRYKNLEKLIKEISKSERDLKIVDVGCGTAKAYSVIKQLDVSFDYVGVELRNDFVEIALKRYGKFTNFQIICKSIEDVNSIFDNVDLIIGLESFEHIPEPVVVRVLENIGKSNFKHLYITVPNEIGPALLLKNIGSLIMGYKRHKYYKWSETIAASLYNLDKVRRHSNGHRGFDWRWLAQTIRQNCRIVKITTSPLNIFPKFISPSIGFICKSDRY